MNRKIHIGCGKDILEGWENYDVSQRGDDSVKILDMRDSLPFKNNEIDYIYSNHALEHITHAEAYEFLKECYRVLKLDGVLRIIIPCIDRAYNNMDDRYRKYLEDDGKPEDKTYGQFTVERISFDFGHKAIYTDKLLFTLLQIIGFEVKECEFERSGHRELDNLTSPHTVLKNESCALEATKKENKDVYGL